MPTRRRGRRRVSMAVPRRPFPFSPMPPLRIALVDDHPIVRAGFKQLLEMEPGWQVAAELGSARELAAWLLSGTCDVLVMDLSLPDGDGLVLIRHVLAQRPDL